MGDTVSMEQSRDLNPGRLCLGLKDRTHLLHCQPGSCHPLRFCRPRREALRRLGNPEGTQVQDTQQCTQQHTHACACNDTHVHSVFERWDCVCVLSPRQLYPSTQRSAKYSNCSVSCIKMCMHPCESYIHAWVSLCKYTHMCTSSHMHLYSLLKNYISKKWNVAGNQAPI